MFLDCGVEQDIESPLDCKEIQPVHPKGDQSWVFTGRTDAEAETPILWPPHVKSWLIGKDPDAGMDWGQEEKGTTENEMAGWHHQLNGCESEQVSGDGEGQGRLVCCSPWGYNESDTTEWLNKNNSLIFMKVFCLCHILYISIWTLRSACFYKIMLSVKNDTFTSSFLLWTLLFILFAYLS